MGRSSSRNSRSWRRKGNGWGREVDVVQVIHKEKLSCWKEKGNGERGRGCQVLWRDEQRERRVVEGRSSRGKEPGGRVKELGGDQEEGKGRREMTMVSWEGVMEVSLQRTVKEERCLLRGCRGKWAEKGP